MCSKYAYFINNLNQTEDLSPKTNGYGKLFVSNENYTYSFNGHITNGTLDNHGLIIYTINKINPTIVKYEGDLLSDEYHGKGKITFTNGDIFIGNFKNNMKHGPGKLYNSIGSIIIDNVWKNDIVYNKIHFIEYFVGTSNIRLQGFLLNSVKIGPWIYYREDKIIDKIEYYKTYDELKDKTINIVEVLQSHIHTNKAGYIISQKLNIQKSLTNYELINFKDYYKTKLTEGSLADLLKDISIEIEYKKQIVDYFLEINNDGDTKIISNTVLDSHYNKKLVNLIIFLPNNKYLIKNNDQMSIYEIINEKLCLYYEGELNRNNLPNGNGIIYNNQKKKFQGTFSNGHIKSGIQYSVEESNHILYNGTFKNNIPDGIGIYYNNEHVKIYEGEILHDKYHGHGVLYWDTTKLKKWEGRWYSGLKHGEGYLYDEHEVLICHCIYEYDNILEVL